MRLASANCLHNFDLIPGLQGSGNVSATRDHLHIDGHSGAFALSNA
jgi:hypothetical protein